MSQLAHLQRIARQPQPGDLAGRGQLQAVVHFVRPGWVHYGVERRGQCCFWNLSKRMSRPKWRRQIERWALYPGRAS